MRKYLAAVVVASLLSPGCTTQPKPTVHLGSGPIPASPELNKQKQDECIKEVQERYLSGGNSTGLAGVGVAVGTLLGPIGQIASVVGGDALVNSSFADGAARLEKRNEELKECGARYRRY